MVNSLQVKNKKHGGGAKMKQCLTNFR